MGGNKCSQSVTQNFLPIFDFPEVFESPVWPRFSQNLRVVSLLGSGFISQAHTEIVLSLHSFQMVYGQAALRQHSLQ